MDVVPLPAQSRSARLIAQSGLSDQEIAEALAGRLGVPVHAEMVGFWRRAAGPTPCPTVQTALASLSSPSAPRVLGRVS